MADGRGFDEFYVESRDRLVRQVAALTGDPVEALDHVQEAFIRAWTRWDRISGYDDPEAWVRRVACNQAVSKWRRARRLVVRSDAGSDAVQFAPEQLVTLDALRRLSVREREVLVLHYLVGYSIEEIGTRLGAPIGTVKSWLSRGRVRLARELGTPEEVSHEQG
jgi:RNA polymerase sigma-70 factor, ECF subfamily